MEQEFQIQTPNTTQIKELVSLKTLFERESGWDPPDEYLEEWIRAVTGIHRKDPNLLRIALVDEKIVGYCISVKRLHSYEGVVMDITWKNAYIWEVYIAKEYREKGIGKAMINETMDYLKSMGVEKVCLIVNLWNETASNFFKKMGFESWGHLLLKRL